MFNTILKPKYSFNSNREMLESKNDNPKIPLDTKINDGCKPPDNNTKITNNFFFLEIYANARLFKDNDSNARKHGHINENYHTHILLYVFFFVSFQQTSNKKNNIFTKFKQNGTHKNMKVAINNVCTFSLCPYN